MWSKAAGLSADEWDYTEGAAGVAAVLDFQRGAGVIPFPAENGGNENVGQVKYVAGEDRRRVNGKMLLRGSSGQSPSVVGVNKLRPRNFVFRAARLRKRIDGVEELRDLRFVRVADDERNAGESGNFFGGALGITTRYEDSRGWIGGVDFADGVTGLGVSGGGDGAGVKNDDVGCGRIGRNNATLFAQLPLDGRAVGLGGTAAELLDKKSAHGRTMPGFYLNIRGQSVTVRVEGVTLYGGLWGLYNFRLP